MRWNFREANPDRAQTLEKALVPVLGSDSTIRSAITKLLVLRGIETAEAAHQVQELLDLLAGLLGGDGLIENGLRHQVVLEAGQDLGHQLRRPALLGVGVSQLIPDVSQTVGQEHRNVDLVPHGAWPVDPDRLKQYVTKALREGKTHTNWMEINRSYESRVLSFIDRLYANNAFLKDFMRLQDGIGYFGALSSVSQLILKIASPGIPDFYRGNEVWDLSLADPDNRRPVDFASRVEMLHSLKDHGNPAELLKNWRDGRLKMYITWKALQFRRSHEDLFHEGEYLPLRIAGARENHIVAFARRWRDQWCVVAVPRLMARLTRRGTPPLGEKVWRDTMVELPPDAPSQLTSVLTGEPLSTPLRASQLFSKLPFSLLTT